LIIVLEILGEIVFTYLVKGLGYVILRFFRRKKIDPDGWPVVIAGFLGWGGIIVLIIVVFNRGR
jgi:hypothetical protein